MSAVQISYFNGSKISQTKFRIPKKILSIFGTAASNLKLQYDSNKSKSK